MELMKKQFPNKRPPSKSASISSKRLRKMKRLCQKISKMKPGSKRSRKASEIAKSRLLSSSLPQNAERIWRKSSARQNFLLKDNWNNLTKKKKKLLPKKKIGKQKETAGA